jgi:hypothetical protein
MFRRIVVIAFSLLALIAAGIGIYALWFDEPQPPHREEPEAPKPTDGLVGTDEFTRLAQTDPVGMFNACLTRYAEQAKGFTAVLEKRECVYGHLHDRERIQVTVWGEISEQPGTPPPIQVRMVWEDGFQKSFGFQVLGSRFSATGKDEQMLVEVKRLGGISASPRGTPAREASRYCIRDSGIYRGMLRTYDAWKKRQDAGELRTEYLGKQVIQKAGDRECHVIRRLCPYTEADAFAMDEQPPTDPKVIARDGFNEVTVMIDVERRLHVGTVLKKATGDLVGEYYFRGIEFLKTEPPSETFTDAGLKAAIQAVKK